MLKEIIKFFNYCMYSQTCLNHHLEQLLPVNNGQSDSSTATFIRPCIQSNLSTTATLGTPKQWPLYISGRSLKGFQSKLLLNLIWPALGWPLLAGGHCSEVAINTGLTVFRLQYFILQQKQLSEITVNVIMWFMRSTFLRTSMPFNSLQTKEFVILMLSVSESD